MITVADRFSLRSPRDVTVKAACEQVDCEQWRHGWRSVIDETTDLGARQATYIRTGSRRTYRESRTDAGLTVFTFESGQRCFAEHHTRPEIYLVQGVDQAGQPASEARIHDRPADWMDHLHETTDRFTTAKERG